MIGDQVEVVSPKGSTMKVPESAFRKVWAARGYRLASDTAEVVGSEAAAEGTDLDLGTPSAEELAAKAKADEEAAALAAAAAAPAPQGKPAGETGAGNSNQTKTS